MLAKKETTVRTSLGYDEALDEALCFGQIEVNCACLSQTRQAAASASAAASATVRSGNSSTRSASLPAPSRLRPRGLAAAAQGISLLRRTYEEAAVAGRIDVVVFDVNETLSDLEPLRDRFTSVGASGQLLDAWFAATLRDGFALTAAGASAPFADIAAASARTLLSGVDSLTVSLDEAVDTVIAGFSELDVHPDVAPGMRRLRDAGLRLVTLTNGSAQVSRTLFQRAGLSDLVELLLSVEDIGRWKPHPSSYAYAAERTGVPLDRMALVAVHPWDVDGAKRAGMIGAWIDRNQRPYPSVMTRPDVTGADLPTVATALLAR